TPAKQFQSVNISLPTLKSGSTNTLVVGTEEYSIELTSTSFSNGGQSGMGGGMEGGQQPQGGGQGGGQPQGGPGGGQAPSGAAPNGSTSSETTTQTT
ncbi:MAG: hypothetical protein QMB62_10860, partial [Oscillospiraceae bacterium]